MPKIDVKITIETSSNKQLDYTVKALVRRRRLIYHEPDENKTKVIYDYENNILTRENNDFYMAYEFDLSKETTGTLEVKSLNKLLNLNIKTNKLLINSNNIELNFLVEEEKINYKLEVIK